MKNIFYIPFVMMSISAACQKQPFPQENSTEIVPYDITIPWSWDSCRVGPHGDHVRYYLDAPECMSLRLVPDSVDHASVWRSSCEVPELWERVADTLEAFHQYAPGKLTFDGGVIYVEKIVSDDVPSPTLTRGIYPRTVERFKRLGIKIKTNQDDNTKPASGKKLTPKAGRAKNAKNTGHYTKRVTWGWNDFRYGPVANHVKLYAYDANCDSVTFVPDSSVYSVVATCGELLKEDWANIANAFSEYKQYNPEKIKFAGNIYYSTGNMRPETKAIFERLGFKVIERSGLYDLPKNTIPWNQANKMLQNKSR